MPAAKQWLRKTPVLYIVLAILLGIALTYRGRDTAARLEEVVRGHELVRPPFYADFPRFTLTDLTPEAEAAGLRTEDVVVAIQGQRVLGLDQFITPVMRAAPGDTLTVDVESTASTGPVARTATITLEPMRRGPATTYDWVRFAIGNVALPYLCLALGFWVTAVR